MNTNPFDFIDECQPWPDDQRSGAQILRDMIECGAMRLRDETTDYTTDVAGKLAESMAAEFFYNPDHRYSPEWVEGACHALTIVLSHLSSSMTVDELQEFMEDVADDVAPRTDKTKEELEIEGFEEWTEAQECVLCHHSFAPEGVAYSIVGTDRACVCKACEKPKPF